MQPIGTDIWHVQGPPLRMPGGVAMPVASTVVRLPDHSLIIYSPIDFDDATAAEVDALGKVAHLIAPSRLHHMFAAAAALRWPRAQVHAAAGVRAKQPALRIDRELGTRPRQQGLANRSAATGDNRSAATAVGDEDGVVASIPAWRGVLELQHIGGAPAIDEHVAFHRPSGTLICSDLLFHITRPANLRTRLVLGLMGVGGGRLAQSRVWRFARRDRDAAQASIDRVLAWPIAQVAPCHGEPCPIDVASLAPRLTRLARIRSVLALAAP